jgi:diadenylate cyclase
MGVQQALRALRGTSLWIGLLDVSLVAYLIYRLLLLARGTRALQILGGLGTLFFALYLSRKLGLYTLNWLLNLVVPLGPVAIVILFYPELRHALEEFGPRFWRQGLSLLSRDDLSEVITAVITAVADFSQKKVGALIVFERQTGLDEVIATGIGLDAAVTPELLESIFFNGTALHDGAVIIRHGRIVAAGCILPLTDQPKVSAAVHTRHKAAIGMSDNSDAVIVVVSEESGTISLALEGKLLRGQSEATLKDRLHKLLQPSERLTGRRRHAA